MNSWFDTVDRTLIYLRNANVRFKDGELTTKCFILDAIGSNAVLTDGKISVTPHYWVTSIAKYFKEKQKMVRTDKKQIKNSLNRAEIEQCGGTSPMRQIHIVAPIVYTASTRNKEIVLLQRESLS